MKFIKEFIQYFKWLCSDGNKKLEIEMSYELIDTNDNFVYGKVVAVEPSVSKVRGNDSPNTIHINMFMSEDMKFIILQDGRIIVGVKDDRSYEFVKDEYGIFGLEPIILNIDDINLGSIVCFDEELDIIILPTVSEGSRVDFGNHLKVYDENKKNLIKWAGMFGGVTDNDYFYTLGFVPIDHIFNKYLLNRIDDYTVSFFTENGIKKLNMIEKLRKSNHRDSYAKISRMLDYVELGNRIKEHHDRERGVRKKHDKIGDLFLKISRGEVGFNSLTMMKDYGNERVDADGRVVRAIAEYVSLYMFNEFYDQYGSVEEFVRNNNAESAFKYASENVSISQTFENLMYFSELNVEYYDDLLDVESGMSEFMEDVNSFISALEEDTDQLNQLDRMIDLNKVEEVALSIVECSTEEIYVGDLAFKEFVNNVKNDKDLMRNAMIEDLVKVYELSIEQGNGFRLEEIESYMRKLVDVERDKRTVSDKFSEVEKSINETLDTLKFYNI